MKRNKFNAETQMKNISRRPSRPTGSICVPILAGFAGVAFSIYGIPTVVEGIKTGQVYSLTVGLGINTIIYRDSSPTKFWVDIFFYAITLVCVVIFSLLTLGGAIVEMKKRIAEKKEKGVANDPNQSNQNQGKEK
jgi:hypothetical protein